MHRHWQRPAMVGAISVWLDTVLPPGATVATVSRSSSRNEGS